MALSRTTLTGAVALGDTTISVASATGVAAGSYIRLDQEILRIGLGYVPASLSVPVSRGQDGTLAQAHPITTGVVIGTGSDFTLPAPSTTTNYPIAGRGVTVQSYTAAGAIALPTDGTDARVILNGTVALAMTLAVPTVDLDASVLTIVGNGKAAHTITVTGGLGAAGAGYTVVTFIVGSQQSVQFIAANAVWVPLPSPFSGTLTAILAALA
jgi:hypothetical protein